MTDEHDKTESEEQLTSLLAETFAQNGELAPSTDAEVERAEAEGVEYEGALPDSLKEFRSPEASESPASEKLGPSPRSEASPRSVVSLEDARRARSSWGTHAVAAVLGAAAASALFIWRSRPPEPGGALPTSEPTPTLPDAAPPPEKIALAALPECSSACCAGASCKASKPELAQCSSGRTCIPCAFEMLADSRYRVRLGAFAPLDVGRKVLENAKGGLELCVRVGSSPLTCTPARTTAEGPAGWSVLPLTVSVQELMAGLTLRVRAVGAETPIGEWLSPVQINATTLCRGLFLKPTTPKQEPLGTVSLFLDDTHFVELGHSATVSALREQRTSFELGALPAKIFETSRDGEQKFSLVLGPFDKRDAEAVRWDLLQKGQTARLTLGDEQVGAALPLD